MIKESNTSNSNTSNKLPKPAIVTLSTLLAVLALSLIEVVTLTPETIILITLIIALSLSCVFDRFSVGKLLEMERTVRSYRDNNRQLEEDKKELYGTLASLTIGIANIQTQTITNKNIQNVHTKVESLSEEQSLEADREEQQSEEGAQDASPSLREIKDAVLSAHYGHSVTFGRRVAIAGQDNHPDPISNQRVVFDAQIECEAEEFVYVVREATNTPSKLFENIYVKLMRIYYYRIAHKDNARMTLLVANESDDTQCDHAFVQKLSEVFRPAIHTGLLKIAVVDVPVAELQDTAGGH
jgi:hypothetical protein